MGPDGGRSPGRESAFLLCGIFARTCRVILRKWPFVMQQSFLNLLLRAEKEERSDVTVSLESFYVFRIPFPPLFSVMVIIDAA